MAETPERVDEEEQLNEEELNEEEELVRRLFARATEQFFEIDEDERWDWFDEMWAEHEIKRQDFVLIYHTRKILRNGCYIFPPSAQLGISRAVNAPVSPMIYRSGRARYPNVADGATYLTHLLVWDVYLGTPPRYGRSYRCKTLYCCNPTHMEDEPEDVRLSRIGCQGTVVGYQAGRYITINSCPHNPKCIHTTNIDSLDVQIRQ